MQVILTVNLQGPSEDYLSVIYLLYTVQCTLYSNIIVVDIKSVESIGVLEHIERFCCTILLLE